MGHVWYIIINILTWILGLRVKIANFSSFFCLTIPKRDLETTKTPRNIEVCPESLVAMSEYWYIERGLLTLIRQQLIDILNAWSSQSDINPFAPEPKLKNKNVHYVWTVEAP